MWTVNRLLVHPSFEQRHSALAHAVVAVNAGAREFVLDWPLPDLSAFEADYAGRPEGFRYWRGGFGVGHAPHSRLAAAWWTDWLGRRHLRLCGARQALLYQMLAIYFATAPQRPPLWLVHPQRTGERFVRGSWRTFVACDCGAAGAPEDLGWMGYRCGPCHDRREAGTIVPEAVPASSAALTHFHPDSILGFLPDNHTLLTAALADARPCLTDLARDQERGLPHLGTLRAAALSPDGSRLAVAVLGGPHTMFVIPTDGRPATPFRLGVGALADVLAFHPDGLRVAVAARGHLLFGAAGGAGPGHLANVSRSDPIRCLAFAPNDSLLAAGSGAGVQLWDTMGRRLVDVLTGPFEYPVALAFSPDGRTLAAAVFPDTAGVQSWRLLDARRKRPLKGSAVALAYAPDGRTLATVGGDGILRLWNAGQGQVLAAYRWHTGAGLAVAFSPDGRRLATSGNDGRVKVWPVPALLGK
jgi:hypothetical protein